MNWSTGYGKRDRNGAWPVIGAQLSFCFLHNYEVFLFLFLIFKLKLIAFHTERRPQWHHSLCPQVRTTPCAPRCSVYLEIWGSSKQWWNGSLSSMTCVFPPSPWFSFCLIHVLWKFPRILCLSPSRWHKSEPAIFQMPCQASPSLRGGAVARLLNDHFSLPPGGGPRHD